MRMLTEEADMAGFANKPLARVRAEVELLMGTITSSAESETRIADDQRY